MLCKKALRRKAFAWNYIVVVPRTHISNIYRIEIDKEGHNSDYTIGIFPIYREKLNTAVSLARQIFTLIPDYLQYHKRYTCDCFQMQ